eukprot:TRINITY_DN8433_c0_g2_i2.p1 TRINITY_DN8433_c0_g2~~TRINITY_DN8433_c0_g2_i2.p1  ORF type:complete len:484 (-),score=76.39 TRINITY_DN8433_c0_g2_i2:8-1459(-)
MGRSRKRAHEVPSEYIHEMDCEEAIDKIGFGIFHWQVYLIVGLFTAADSVEIGFISFVTEVLKDQWDFTEGTKATMESMIFIGMLIGAPTWGWLADKYGRRPVMLISAFFVSFFGFLTAICMDKYALIPFRFGVGFGCSGCVVAFDVFAELLPSEQRGPLTMSTFYWFTAGSLYSNFAAKYFLCSAGWRTFTVVCALPTLLATVAGFFLVPESAHWLVAEKRPEAAAKVLNSIASKNGKPLEFGSVSMPEVLEDVGALDLVRRHKLRTPLLFMAFTWIGWGLAYYGIALILPRLFSQHDEQDKLSGASQAEAADCYGIKFDFQDIMISNLGQAIGLTIGILLVNRVGRVRTQQMLYIVGAAFAVGLGFPDMNRTALTVFSTVSLAAVNGASSCTWSHTPELFPTHARVLATGICSACARLGAASAPYVISDLIPPLPTALIMASFSAVAAIAVSFVRETHGAAIDDDHNVSSSDEDDGSSEEH